MTAGGGALGIHVTAGFSVTLVTGLVLKFVLAPGHDYYLYSNRRQPGISWQVWRLLLASLHGSNHPDTLIPDNLATTPEVGRSSELIVEIRPP